MKTRVLVVDDSITVRARLVEVLSADPEIEVVGEAGDGKRAFELCLALRPNVVTLDMVLPVMTGLTATEQIMAYCPTPILIVSASTNRGELFKTYDALAAGALEVLDKPSAHDTDEDWAPHFVSTVKLLARLKVITHPRARLGALASRSSGAHLATPMERSSSDVRVIALGASTGGPGALLEVLRGLPRGFPIPILITMHLATTFAGAFASWLDEQSPLRVTFARDGEPLPSVGEGRIVLAPPDAHLTVSNGRLRNTNTPPRHSCRPSVDALFESLAVELGSSTAACLLTGMGRDGAAGLLSIRVAGGRTIAQDEASSVVFGMPREAIQLGAAERVLPLSKIAAALTALAPINLERSIP